MKATEIMQAIETGAKAMETTQATEAIETATTISYPKSSPR